MAEEIIAFESGRISNSQGLVTLTLILDRVILHTIVRRRNVFVDGRTYVSTDGRIFETHFIRSTQKSRFKN